MANNEWGTPSDIIERARQVMGSVDTDPASNDFAQLTVKAGTYYTLQNSGLDKEWMGNVWLNPPYGYGLAKPFTDRLAVMYRHGAVKQAIVLTNAVHDTIWWRESVGVLCSAICLPKRIAFVNPETGVQEKGDDRNQIISYIGDDPDKFCAEFADMGLCFKAPLKF